jgi:hypothetical protein
VLAAEGAAKAIGDLTDSGRTAAAALGGEMRLDAHCRRRLDGHGGRILLLLHEQLDECALYIRLVVRRL